MAAVDSRTQIWIVVSLAVALVATDRANAQEPQSEDAIAARATTVAMLLRMCWDGEPTTCTALASNYITPTDFVRDISFGAAMLSTSCDAGHTPACEALHQLVTALDGRCGTNDLAACTDLAEASGVLEGAVTDEDVAALAYARLENACNGGVVRACADLGHFHANAMVVAEDTSAAYSLFERACSAGDPYGCTYQAQLISFGLGAEQDHTLAYSMYLSACESGSPAACHYLSGMVRLGRGIEADPLRSLRLQELSCSQGFGPACATLVRARDQLQAQ